MNRHAMAIGLAILAGLGAGRADAQQTPAAAPAATPPPSASSAPALTPSPAGAQAYIISPVDGARLHGPFIVRFGLKSMGVTQAGSTAKDAGHHHLLVDVTDRLDPNAPIPADKKHLHFGGGQTETRLDLPPGRHTLQLVLGDAGHRLFSPSVESPKIHIVIVSPTKIIPRHHVRKRHRAPSRR